MSHYVMAEGVFNGNFKVYFYAIKSKSSVIVSYTKHFLLLSLMVLRRFDSIILITQAEGLT